ncbi:hypothetical protein EDD18DRAFT_1103666 [Armillaria luteobubalina]|uniref:Uncharacterized protein n=1 Tax=Armillaria luteobubalina TaxID=153913 RepID=A0AA39QAE1_9AGAR|nr:hypothetical protein EDD18DRAFT_1103666 [Armillaria luteobubalina]
MLTEAFKKQHAGFQVRAQRYAAIYLLISTIYLLPAITYSHTAQPSYPTTPLKTASSNKSTRRSYHWTISFLRCSTCRIRSLHEMENDASNFQKFTHGIVYYSEVTNDTCKKEWSKANEKIKLDTYFDPVQTTWTHRRWTTAYQVILSPENYVGTERTESK